MLFRLSVPRRWRQTDRLPVRAFQICFGLSRCLGLWRALETRKRREEKKEMDGRGDAVAVAGAGSRSVAMWEDVLFTNARRYTTHIRKYARRDVQYARMRTHTHLDAPTHTDTHRPCTHKHTHTRAPPLPHRHIKDHSSNKNRASTKKKSFRNTWILMTGSKTSSQERRGKTESPCNSLTLKFSIPVFCNTGVDTKFPILFWIRRSCFHYTRSIGIFPYSFDFKTFSLIIVT